MPYQLPCAYLRVYRPFDQLPPSDRRRVEHPGVERSVHSVARQALGLVAPAEAQEVYERVVDGRRFVCLGHTRLRALLGLAAFERSLPQGVIRCFFSQTELDTARRELAAIESETPEPRPSIVQSAWHVPLRWFVCFDDAERRLEHDGDATRIRYETTVGDALARVEAAFSTLKEGVVNHPVIAGMIYELREWLQSFELESLLELDYASVATLFDPDDLADDRSASDVWAAIHALASGDGMSAGLHYRRANERWHRSRSKATSN
jgi:hypothetical protein